MKGGDYMKNILLTLFIGIDVSAKSNHIYAMNFEQNQFLSMKVKNNLPGSNLLIEKIVTCLQNNQFTHTIIALESTSNYSVHLATRLASSERLLAFNTEVYCLNPKIIKGFKKSFTDIDKTDPDDAYVIADFARVGKIITKPWNGSQHITLKRLSRHRYHLATLLTREKNYTLNNMYLKFSQLAAFSQTINLFSNNFSTTTQAVLNEFYSPEDIINTPLDELIDFIVKHSKNSFKDPEAKAKLLRKAARDSYKLDKLAYDPLNTAIASSFNVIKSYEKEIKVVNKALKKAILGFNATEYQCLISIPGIGPIFAAGILAEIGSIQFFDSNDALAKYAGITWRQNESGESSKDDTPMTKTGVKYLRYYLIEAANSVRRYAPEYKAYYHKKYNESSTHKHKRALAFTARKLIRLIYALLSKGQLYSNSKVESKTNQ
jgi:transposase